MIYPVAMVCIPVWLAIVLVGVASLVLTGWASALLAMIRIRKQASAEAAGYRRRIGALEGEVMALEARSRGVGGTGEYRTTGIEPVASPGWAAQATPTPRGADAPRPAATDR